MDQAEANTDIAVQFGLIAPDQLSRLTWVEMDLDDPDSIRPAIGGATKVCVWGGVELRGGGTERSPRFWWCACVCVGGGDVVFQGGTQVGFAAQGDALGK